MIHGGFRDRRGSGVLYFKQSNYIEDFLTAIGAQVAAIGEVGLTGELRNVNNLSQRLSEVRRLGFTECIIPKQHGNRLGCPDGLKLTEVQNVGEALRVLARS